MNLRQKLLNGDKKIGVWGTGFIGYSSMAYFANKGVKCIGYDISKEIVDKINKGEIPVPGLGYWLAFDVQPLVKSGMLRCTTDFKELMQPDVAVHLIAIPTEKEDKPWDGALIDVVQKLSQFKSIKTDEPPLVIIESTLTPGRSDQIILPIFEKAGLKVGKDILVGIAPRRDWFISSDKSLKNLPRIIGGTTPETTEKMRQVLSLVVDTLHAAPDHKHAEMVKSIENAYRHVGISLANELTLAYPDINIREVLRLVGTKWNIPTYQPSFGTGGYCIPLSSQYVLLGTEHKDMLKILNETIAVDCNMPYLVSDSVIKRGAKKVGILGLSYKGNLKVHILSPTLKIAKYLKDKGLSVKVNDPQYTPDEIKRIIGLESFDFPKGLSEFDTILLIADHREYTYTQIKDIFANLSNCKLILDNTGIWAHLPFKEKGIEYHVAGDKGWLAA